MILYFRNYGCLFIDYLQKQSSIDFNFNSTKLWIFSLSLSVCNLWKQLNLIWKLYNENRKKYELMKKKFDLLLKGNARLLNLKLSNKFL